LIENHFIKKPFHRKPFHQKPFHQKPFHQKPFDQKAFRIRSIFSVLFEIRSKIVCSKTFDQKSSTWSEINRFRWLFDSKKCLINTS
jgi:hypothetical protein